MKKRFPCACCGNYVFEEDPYGEYWICPVCYWESDDIQEDDLNFSGGSNNLSLNEAKKVYHKLGASEKKFVKKVRKPFNYELPKNNKKNLLSEQVL